MRQAISNGSGMAASIQRFWHRSYAADYVGFMVILAAYIGVSTRSA